MLLDAINPNNVTLEEEAHIYHRDGEIINGVTRTLAKIGLYKERYYKPGAGQKGTDYHRDLEYYDVFDTPIGRELQRFLEKYEIKLLHREAIVYCKEYDYAGKIDAIGIFRGKPIVIDYKTGSQEDWHRHQLAAYAMPLGIKQGLRLYIKPDKVKPIFLEELPMEMAIAEFRRAYELAANSKNFQNEDRPGDSEWIQD